MRTSAATDGQIDALGRGLDGLAEAEVRVAKGGKK